MPKLPRLTPQKIIKILESRGFVLDRTKGSHHVFFHPESKRRAVVPVHRKDLPVGTLIEILKQAGIEKDDMREFL
jgi:predicted RNA binding protein YcfA (HicA-like mRNA interferase family)